MEKFYLHENVKVVNENNEVVFEKMILEINKNGNYVLSNRMIVDKNTLKIRKANTNLFIRKA